METKTANPGLATRLMSRGAGFPVHGSDADLPFELPDGFPAELLGAGVGGAAGTVVADDKVRGLLRGLGVGAGVIGGGRLALPADGEPDLRTVLGALAGGGLGYVGGGLAADLVAGRKRRGVLPDDLEKEGEAHPALPQLLLAKAHSDRRQYLRKHAILRQLLADNPADFVVDSRAADGIIGLTHRPTSFQIHMPGHMLPAGVAPAAPDPAARLLALADGGGR